MSIGAMAFGSFQESGTVQPMAEISQKTGVPIEACVFIGSSPIRQYAEEIWGIRPVPIRLPNGNGNGGGRPGPA